MFRNLKIFYWTIFASISLNAAQTNNPYSGNPPYTFPIPEEPFCEQFFVVSPLESDSLRYVFRSKTKLYGYSCHGIEMWSVSISNPGMIKGHSGSKAGAADIDGDNRIEVVAIDSGNHVLVYNGLDGTLERTITITGLAPDQILGFIAIVNLRGQGDHDAIVQTIDTTPEGSGIGYYINRILVALNLEDGSELWRIEQDGDPNSPVLRPDGIYEGYWGQAHGGLMCADVDGDGLDEIIGGNMVDNDGTVIDLGYTKKWITRDFNRHFIDHLDCIAVGDFRPDLPGLEWVMTEEDHLPGPVYDNYWHTTMLHYDPANPDNGILWMRDAHELFPNNPVHREPQAVAVGNFDTTFAYSEIRNESRFVGTTTHRQGIGQHPWIYASDTSLIAHYSMNTVLPAGFNKHANGNAEGLEMTWTIDWMGRRKEYIAGEARHVYGNVGLFDAMTGEPIWYTSRDFPAVNASFTYVADVGGDSREEVIVCDSTDTGFKIRVYWNNTPNHNQPKPNKWEDPLYRRLKQNWGYYFPGSYTYGDYPIISNIVVSDTTPVSVTITWQTDELSDSQIEYGETSSYGSETTRNSTLVTNHSVEITGLNPGKEYHFRVKSRNEYNKLGMSSDNTFVTLGLVPPEVTDASIQNLPHIRLTWKPVEGAAAYNVYRDTIPYFEPDKARGTNRVGTNVSDEDAALSDVQWDDTSNVVGNSLANYFYIVTALNGSYESDFSNRIGEFDFKLITTPTTDFNGIALPLVISEVTNAQELMNKIPGCNSIARWNAEYQAYEQYVPAVPQTNFSVEMGFPYYVNATVDTVFTLTGELTSPTFNLITTPSTDFNEVMLPLDKTNITKASELLSDIPYCNSVARWNAAVQGYEQYIPALPSTDFEVTVGYPYYVNVTQNVVWPGEETSKVPTPADIVHTSSTKAPHLVWGNISSKDNDIHFKAFIVSRPGEILTDASPGCMIKERYWAVQCASFTSPWKAGEVLKVVFESGDGNLVEMQVELTYEPADRAEKINIKKNNLLPLSYELSQNFPNPFNFTTVVKYQVPEQSRVFVGIYNILGKKIRTLIDREVEPGFYETWWDGRDENKNIVSSGLYFIQMRAGKYSKTRKLLFVQ